MHLLYVGMYLLYASMYLLQASMYSGSRDLEGKEASQRIGLRCYNTKAGTGGSIYISNGDPKGQKSELGKDHLLLGKTDVVCYSYLENKKKKTAK